MNSIIKKNKFKLNGKGVIKNLDLHQLINGNHFSSLASIINKVNGGNVLSNEFKCGFNFGCYKKQEKKHE